MSARRPPAAVRVRGVRRSIRGLRAWLAVALLGCVAAAGCLAFPGRDVHFEPTPPEVVQAMLELAEVRPGDLVVDLGSGDGRIPIAAALDFGARGLGIEIDRALVARADAAARAAGVADRVQFRVGDMHAADLRGATVVTLFLNPRPNLKLRPKLQAELPPGSRVVSYIWDMKDWRPDAARTVNGRRIFLWRIPAQAPARNGR